MQSYPLEPSELVARDLGKRARLVPAQPSRRRSYVVVGADLRLRQERAGRVIGDAVGELPVGEPPGEVGDERDTGDPGVLVVARTNVQLRCNARFVSSAAIQIHAIHRTNLYR